MAKFRKTAFLMGLLTGYAAQLFKRGSSSSKSSRTLGQSGSNESVFNTGGRSGSSPQNENVEGAERISREI